MERVIRLGGPAVDLARKMLDALDENDANESEWQLVCEKTNCDTVEQIAAIVAEHEEIESIMESDSLAKEMPGTGDGKLLDRFKHVLNYARDQESIVMVVRQALIESGVLAPGDHETDLADILRLFLQS